MKRILNMNKIAKKTIILISFLALNLPVFSEVTSSIEIKEVIDSPSTSIDHPGNYLIDGDNSTSWGFSPESTTGWAEIEIIKPVHIFGIKQDSQLPDDVEMELSYKKDGQFYPFSGGKIKSGINDESIIDLSFDNIVTDNIKISITGSNLNGSLINEIDIIGEYSDEVFYKINPVALKESENGNPFFPAKNLVDGNTKTGWRTDNSNELPAYNSLIKPFLDKKSDGYWDSGNNHGSGVLFELAGSRKLDKLKVYLKENRTGQLSIEAMIHEEWIEIVNIPVNTQWGWLTYPLDNIQTDKIRLLVDGSTGDNVEISEIEFWGYGDYTGDEVILLTNLSENVETEGYIFHCDLENDKPYYFEIETADSSGASQINYELNGKELVGDKVVSNGYSTIYRTFIEPNRIYTFDNVIKVPNMDNLDKVVMRVCRADGLFRIGSGSLSDSFFLTPNTGSGTINWSLSQSINIERMELYSDRLADSQISTQVDGSYTPLNILEKNEYRTVFEGREEVQQIRYNDYYNSGFSELNILGCLTNIGPVSTKLFNRETDFDANDSAIYQFLLLGTIDDENAKVLINGIEALQEGYYFWLPITTLGLGSGDSTELVIKTVLPSGEETTQNTQFTAVAGKVDKFDIDLEITGDLDNRVVNNPYVNIEGYISGYGELFIDANGNPGSISNNRFSIFGCPIVEGENSITVRASNRYNKVVTKTITVVRDTVDPVFGDIAPDENHIFSTSSVKFSGYIFDHNLKDVVIDGKEAVLNGDNFTISFNLVDGFYSLPIKATDLAGNEQDGGFLSFVVDTRIPEPFTPVSSSTGWTNSYPEISFSATDATSGIDYYQISVAGSDFETVTSPYQITEIPEGEQVVIVKAVDKAGHVQAGSVAVLIDTVSPEQPVINKVVPGNNQVEIFWQDFNTDVDKYSISRLPEWENGSVVVSELNYIDELAVNGTEYTYSVVSIDHAGNESPAVTSEVVKGGISSVEIAPDDNVKVLFENVSISFDKEAIPENVKTIEISQVESQDLIDDADFTSVTPIYNYNVVYDNGESPEFITFNESFISSIDYDESSFPEGIFEETLSVFYYDQTWGEWFIVEGSAIDTENNRIYFATNHFTDYTVAATAVQALTPQELQDSGYSPFHSYSKHESVSLSPQSGNIVTSAVELSLPGFNGFDLVIKRQYDTSTAKIDGRIDNSTYDRYKKDLNKYRLRSGDYGLSIGRGWRLDFPAFISSPTGKNILLPGGSQVSLSNARLKSVDYQGTENSQKRTRKLVLEVHDSNNLYIEVDQIEVKKRVFGSNDDIENELHTYKLDTSKDYPLTVIAANGIKYQFNSEGVIKKIIDPNTPDNEITFSTNGKMIESITDTLGRVIKLTYKKDNQDRDHISSILIENDTEYNRYISYEQNSDGLLELVNDAGGRDWHYGYENFTVDESLTNFPYDFVEKGKDCVFGYISDFETGLLTEKYEIKSADLLNYVSGPGLGSVQISYEYIESPVSFIAKKIKIYDEPFGTDLTSVEPEKESDFFYTYNLDSITQCLENDGSRYYIYNYKPYSKNPLNWKFVDGEIKHKHSGQRSKLSYQSEKITRDDKTDQIQEKLITLFDTSTMNLKNSKLWRSDDNYTFTEYEYDDWGNTTLQNTKSVSHGIETKKEIYNYYLEPENPSGSIPDASKVWDKAYSESGLTLPEKLESKKYDCLLARIETNYIPQLVNDNPVVVEMPEEPQYSYSYIEFNGKGQNTGTSKWDGSKWLKSNNTFHSDGLLESSTNPEEHKTSFVYDGNGFLDTATNHDVLDADGNTYDIITETSYDKITGWKQWERSGNDYGTERKTVYSYDSLGRVIKITHPNNTFLSITYNPVNSNEKWSELIDENGAKTRFEYNGIGKLVKIIKYQRDINDIKKYIKYSEIEMGYDEVGNIVSIEDQNKNITKYSYDNMNRNNGIIYPDETESLSDNSVTSSILDYKTNIIYNKDELLNEIEEFIDMNNRVVKTVAHVDNKEIISANYYDSNGNVIISIDPNGNISRNEYNCLNQLVKTTLPGPSTEYPYFENGVEVTDSDNSPYVSYIYDDAGFLSNQIRNTKDGLYQVDFTVNGLGQKIKTATPYTYIDPETDVETNRIIYQKMFYDKNGNKTEIIDGLNSKLSVENRKSVKIEYDLRNRVEKEINQEGHFNKYTYDNSDNVIKLVDILGNIKDKYASLDFTIDYKYDDLNRLVTGTLPKRGDQTEKPEIQLEYDFYGNLTKRTEPNGKIISYEYTPRNWLEKETHLGDEGKSYEILYEYFDNGLLQNRTDPGDRITEYFYDSIGRQVKVKYPEGNTERIEYDNNGNTTAQIDGKGYRTKYIYDNQNRLVKELDASPEKNETRIFYDRWGNKTKTVDKKNRVFSYEYDELNRITKETNPLLFNTLYRYDDSGNIVYTQDANGTKSSYAYSDTNLLTSISIDNKIVNLSTYDESGNLKSEDNGDVLTRYNYSENVYIPDPFGYINSRQTTINNKDFDVHYTYDEMGALKSITSPDNEIVEYEYNKLGELSAVKGYLDEENGPQYNSSGFLRKLTAVNGIDTNYDFDLNGRLKDLEYSDSNNDIYHKEYIFDENSNIKSTTDLVNILTNSYEYDNLNRIKRGELQGDFEYKSSPEDRIVGTVYDDVLGDKSFERIVVSGEIVYFDYAAGSIVADLQQVYPVTKVVIDPDEFNTRINENTLSVYSSMDNVNYSLQTGWAFSRMEDGEIELVFDSEIETRYIKIHSHFNNRDNEYNSINDSTFFAKAEDIIQVYYIVSSKTEKYDYDAVGNRISREETVHNPDEQKYYYYPDSDRLMSDGTFSYQYDANGNLVKKGNHIQVDNVPTKIDEIDNNFWERIENSIDSIDFSLKGVYWEYNYNYFNQLLSVKKYDNELESLQVVAEYKYDINGNRLYKSGSVEEYFIFNENGQILYEEIYEKDSSELQESSTYVYVLGKHFARIGKISDVRSVSYYHTDNLGSVIAVTDETGGLLWSNEYGTFGGLSNPLDTFKHANKYTGKDFDEDTGLYYFNARWYDASLGKFITEDPIKDGVNWYVYCGNNPMIRIDPTGLDWANVVRGFRLSWQATKELPSSTAKGLAQSWERTKTLPATTKKGIKDSIPGLREAASVVIATQADVFGDVYTFGTQIFGYDPIAGKDVDASGLDIGITFAAILIAGVSAKTADMVMTSKKAVREMADVSGDVVEAGKLTTKTPKVETPYGPALQSSKKSALDAIDQVENGADLYRTGTLGKSAAGEAQFWALEHPSTPGYANRYGVPPENVLKADFIESATIKPGANFVTRPAPPMGTNGGGGIEVVVPESAVSLNWFDVIKK